MFNNAVLEVRMFFILLRFFIILVVMLSLVGCGKMKIDSSKQEIDVKVSDSNHRVDVVQSVDLEGLYDVFTPMCEKKYVKMPDGPDRDEKVAECIEDNLDKVLNIVDSGSLPGNDKGKDKEDN